MLRSAPLDRRGLLGAIGLFVALRGLCVAVLAVFAADRDASLLRILGRSDASWYAGVVTRGYDTAIPLAADGSLLPTNLAFFPLFPGLVAVVDPVLPGGAGTAGIVVAWLCGIGAAAGIYAVGAHVRGRRTGVLLAGLWAVLPHGVVLSMGYTEPLFTGLAAWTLWALLRRSWVAAGALCLLAGLTRPTAAALVATVGLCALVAVVRREDGWRPWVAGALAPLGLLGYIAWVGQRLGSADAYFRVQNDAWKMSYDAGGFTLTTTRDLLTQQGALAYYVTAAVVLVAIGLLVVLATDQVPWPLVVFAGIVVALTFFGAGYYHAKARLLLPAFPLLLPVAAGLAAARRTVLVVVLSVLTAISAGYGVYLTLAWRYSP
ncbi:glycosyltransferase family 39 protein [Pimelobacter simplex]|uniref:glycosyltransferase family 39 protein n=1 Tax=Nocardioides simplex TaxID=2045 RepID=UPI00214FEBF4|nr:glycosyltransferase family 39 protein [Pimelobacter simplex]UUW92358.1 glycosyltransferase family 39 protein [Pimelobacter simplex]UUW96186.1 glycosyltransferase family 39 protein [Pimelobacter simplex]